jgi:predicted metal-dependent phosphoesterase TrpH
MIIDFHMHERTFSSDSQMNLKEMIFEAKRKGLDGICITDHDEYGLAEYAAKLSKIENFPIFVGVEHLSLEGDIVAFGISDLPKGHLPAQEFIDWVNNRDGVCIAAHPFRSNSRGLEENLLTIKGLTGIEVLNGSTSNAANLKAMEYCMKLGLQPIGASDCHNLISLGRYATYVPMECKTVEDLVKALKTVRCEPVILSGYKKFKF